MSDSTQDSSPTIGELGFEVVDHLRHERALEIRALLNAGTGQVQSHFLIDDPENIEQAIRAGLPLESLYFSGEHALPEDLRAQIDPSVQIYEVARRTCKKLFDKERASRLFAIAKTPAVPDLESLAGIEQDLVVLDHLTIQGNIGAIIRNAVAFRIGAVVLLGADPQSIYDRRLIRSSRGYVFSIAIVAASSEDFLAFAKKQGIEVALTCAHANTAIADLEREELQKPIAVVLGSEKHGCSQEIREGASLSLSIPMNLEVESLNVSAACAILMHRRYAFNARGFEGR